jgi:four helix bundle protein
MQFGHEQLDVYQVSIRHVSWAYEVAKGLQGIDRHERDQLMRASQSIPLNIAEGNGKGTNADRRRFFEIARGSALEAQRFRTVWRPAGCRLRLRQRQRVPTRPCYGGLTPPQMADIIQISVS